MARKKDFFKKLPTAKGSKGGAYFPPDSHYEVEILKCIDNDGREDDHFIIECKTLDSDNPKVKKGFCASQVITLSNDSAPGNVANFLRAAFTVFSRDEENGLDELDPTDDEDWEDIEDMYFAAGGEDNVLMGVVVYLKTTQITTKKGKPFTKHTWSADRPASWSEEDDED